MFRALFFMAYLLKGLTKCRLTKWCLMKWQVGDKTLHQIYNLHSWLTHLWKLTVRQKRSGILLKARHLWHESRHVTSSNRKITLYLVFNHALLIIIIKRGDLGFLNHELCDFWRWYFLKYHWRRRSSNYAPNVNCTKDRAFCRRLDICGMNLDMWHHQI